MIALLMNLVLMGAILTGALKAYYDIPLLNENPKTTSVIAVMVLLLIIWIFPRIIVFLIKMAIFSSIVYFICDVMGWDMSFLKSNTDDTKKAVESITETLTSAFDEAQMAIQPSQTFSARAKAVNTGNTFQVGNETIQLYGIDAPDIEQTCRNRTGGRYNCGSLSKQQLQSLVDGKELSCESKGKNRFGQSVASCSVDGDDLGALMVRSGWAVADRKATNFYVSDEKVAHDRKIGMWDGKFQAPWTWRSKRADSASSREPSKTDNATPFEKMMNFFTK